MTSEMGTDTTMLSLFELRFSLDDFELRGHPARAALIDVTGRIPCNNSMAELARAHAALQ